jgi:hypothetical protein
MPAEFWITYHFTSRVHLPPTTQLVELENPDHKLTDLEDVLEHGTFWVCRTPCNSLMVAGALVFRQGFVDAKYRPVTWWEKKDGVRVKASAIIADLLTEGVGICPDDALRLVIGKRCIKKSCGCFNVRLKTEDVPTDLWFSYIYIHNPHARVITQRVKFAGLERRFERLAHVTNYIFAQGFLPSKYRAVVHWETPCGRPISEFEIVDEILVAGEGITEENPLRLVIG